MIKVIEAPNEDYSIDTLSKNKKVFIAGGITNCPDWQSELIQKIQDYFVVEEYNYSEPIDNITLYNPRRENFPIDDPNASEVQISWEYKHLKESDIIIFWFSKGSLNPIVLYELGRWGNSQLKNKKIIIGIDPEYERKQDVIVQSKLDDYYVEFCNSLDEIVETLEYVLTNEL